MGLDEVLRRTTGRTGVECMGELFDRPLGRDEALKLVAEKEGIYRELFAPVFAEVAGFRAFAKAAAQRGLKLAIGTAGDKHNIDFVMSRLNMAPAPQAVVGGDQGLPGKPEPAIFLEAARQLGVPPADCVVFEDAPLGIEAARRAGMRAVAICTTHTAGELGGSHVIAQVRDYHALLTTNFLETLDA
jgi:beta-phosphoglucomutase-like phosphatase (HAD superfamily)